MTIIRRIIGGTIILVGLAGLAAGLYGVYWLPGAAERLERETVSGMDFGLEGLELISDTLQVLTQTVDNSAAVLDAAVVSSQRTAETLDAIRPAVTQINDIVTKELPHSIQAIQDTLPALEQAAGAIDSTLRTLAGFQWSATVPIVNYELGFGLDIEYNPETPLGESVAEVGQALDNLPPHLANIRVSLLDTNHRLTHTVASVEQIGQDLATVGQDLHDTSAVLAEYNTLAARATQQVRQVRRDIRQQFQTGRVILSGVLVWLALSQLAPLYLGCTLVSTKLQ